MRVEIDRALGFRSGRSGGLRRREPQDHPLHRLRDDPSAFGLGDGAAGRTSMATVVIGGQMLSLLVALITTPVF